MATIILPKNLDELLKLAKCIVEKHYTESSKSPLFHTELEQLNSMINSIDPKYKTLLELRERANELNDEIQTVLGIHRAEKKIMPGTARFIVAQSRDILKGIYREDLSRLNEWGFEVIVKEKRSKVIG